MGLFNLLSKEELSLMDAYINSYVDEGCDTNNRADLSYLLRYWESNKEESMYGLLGKNLLISQEIEVKMTDSELQKKISKECLSPGSNGWGFYKSFSNFIDTVRYKNDDYHYVEDEDARDVANLLNFMLWSAPLSYNQYRYDTFTLITPEGKKLVIQNGCKLSKALGRIAKAFNLEGYEEFRIAHSVCLNEKTYTGKLTLSIHPMDFMTMSDNANSWSSCMSWTDRGAYRRGTVEMMNSPCIVCAYLESTDREFTPCYNQIPWNSKRWRELFIVTPQAIVGIKGYPTWNRDIEREVLIILRELAQTNLHWGPYNSTPYWFEDGKEFYLPEFDRIFTFEFETNAMYNDFCYEHQILVSGNASSYNNICYSGESLCMWCGSVINSFDSEECLACDDCAQSNYICSDCGRRINMAWDSYYYIDGRLVCSWCADNYETCVVCGGLHDGDCETRVNLARLDKNVMFDDYFMYVCDDCWDRFVTKYNVQKSYDEYGCAYYYADIHEFNVHHLHEWFAIPASQVNSVEDKDTFYDERVIELP